MSTDKLSSFVDKIFLIAREKYLNISFSNSMGNHSCVQGINCNKLGSSTAFEGDHNEMQRAEATVPHPVKIPSVSQEILIVMEEKKEFLL